MGDDHFGVMRVLEDVGIEGFEIEDCDESLPMTFTLSAKVMSPKNKFARLITPR